MLACAWLCHVAGTQWGGKEYMDMKHLEAMEAGELQEGSAPVGSDPAAQWQPGHKASRAGQAASPPLLPAC